jgi:hypothetical protein
MREVKIVLGLQMAHIIVRKRKSLKSEDIRSKKEPEEPTQV